MNEKNTRQKDICNKCKLQDTCPLLVEGDFWLEKCQCFVEDK